MHHTHFPEIDSTQLYLLEHLADLQSISPDVLISTDKQTAGQGRNQKSWDYYSHSLAMSFTFRPHSVPTLTPLEIGILTSLFFESRFKFKLHIKWPNDLLLDQKKCGGILTKFINTDTVVAGLGLNIGSSTERRTDYKHGLSFLNSERLCTYSLSDLSAELYHFMLKHRLSKEDLVKEFNNRCAHLNVRVEIDDDGTHHQGVFRGIGEFGEALIASEGAVKPFFSSSLKIL